MRCYLVLLLTISLFACAADTHAQTPSSGWSRLILDDQPAMWWSFDGKQPLHVHLEKDTPRLDVRIDGRVATGKSGTVSNT